MTIFEQTWHDKYMNNLCTEATLIKLVNAKKLSEEFFVDLKAERLNTLGY